MGMRRIVIAADARLCELVSILVLERASGVREIDCVNLNRHPWRKTLTAASVADPRRETDGYAGEGEATGEWVRECGER